MQTTEQAFLVAAGPPARRVGASWPTTKAAAADALRLSVRVSLGVILLPVICSAFAVFCTVAFWSDKQVLPAKWMGARRAASPPVRAG